MNYKHIIFSSLLFVSNLTFASTVDLNKYFENKSEVSIISQNLYVQNELRSILGQEYKNFSQNFEVFHAPYKLKTAKAVYIEGKKTLNNDASAATIYDDGRMYLAYYDSHKNVIRYFTNDKSCSKVAHPSIQVFMNHYPNAKIQFTKKTGFKYLGTSQNCNIQDMRFSQKKIVASDTPAQAATRSIAEKIWNPSIANSLDINDEVGVVISKAVKSITTCSANFNLVPKPHTMGDLITGKSYFISPGIDYIRDYFKEIMPYILGLKEQPTYQACINATALNYRTELELASLGI
ncbi:hypothetical protein [Acinetobacter pollinis]|uniref:Uncharacterized protein n=1 Tax=Acinetobacter pollinis TaxID=2605270 RepID=A0ABU6DXK5_9GAMM|nr:hypothetical protein [Acinetobacter pollinis]MEB5477603.1 hypothetical protein [Acinetobacter pollinis]